MKDLSHTRLFWDEETGEGGRHFDWMSLRGVRAYLNTLIGGTEHDWPMNWFVRFLGGRRFGRVLSIGCGSGALERDLIRRDLADRVDAMDASVGSLAIAREEAQREGMSARIRYFAADFNEPSLPRETYDAIFFHHSLHHVAKLEKLLRAVMLALKSDGLLYLDEYVGPSRTWWTDARFVRERELYDRLVPRKARKVRELPLPVVYEDPSEAVRSGEILPQLRVGFRIVEQRGYGGNLLSVICPGVRWKYATPTLLNALIDAERELLATGADPYLAVVVAAPRQGLARRIAAARYFSAPKIRRIGRELRGLLRSPRKH